MRLRRAGLAGVLAELESQREVWALYEEALRWRRDGLLDDVVEVVPAARSVLFDHVEDPAALAGSLRSWASAASAAAAGAGGLAAGGPLAGGGAALGRVVELAVRYDGPDLKDVGRRWGVPPSGVAELHAGLSHTVAFLGFAPGFAYIAGLPPELRLPRLDRPRADVPAGSVALADEYTGIYPRTSPGGWRLIGSTDAALFDLARTPPALLAPGDTVRFVPVRR